MPPRKVYGKSRAIYDPFALFDSPQRRRPEAVKETRIDTCAPKLSKLTTQDSSQARSNDAQRAALGEINVNERALPKLELRDKKRRGVSVRKKLVVEDSDDEELEENLNYIGDGAELTEEIEKKDEAPLPRNGDVFEPEDAEAGRRIPHLSDDEALAVPEDQCISSRDTAGISISPEISAVQDEYTEHCFELLELSSHGMTNFLDWSNALSEHFDIVKIAEASFSEVYRLLPLEQVPGLSSSDESVFKVIPLRAPPSTLPTEKRKCAAALKKGENMSLPNHVANEVRLLHRMSNIPGLTNFRDVRIVQGRPPKPFQKAFKDFNASQIAKRKQVSLFPDPTKATSYADDQLWAVVEMQDAGTDLEQLVESGECTSIWLIWDAFWQIAVSLAKGEEGAEFEHRDLHLGNVCVRMPLEQEAIRGSKRKLDFTGLETTIIDYTISRASMQDDTIAYHDLANDATLFEGDSNEEYQYEIYRHMRSAVFLDDACADFTRGSQNNDRSWRQYHPITNLIWLHFILYKLLEGVDWPSATKAPPRKNKEEHATWKRANDLEHVLLRVRDLLDLNQICQSHLTSTGELVSLALREGWLDGEDVVGAETDEEIQLIEQFETLEIL